MDRTFSTPTPRKSSATCRGSRSGGRISTASARRWTDSWCRSRSTSTPSTSCTARGSRRWNSRASLRRWPSQRHPLKTSEDVIVNRVGRELYEKFFRNYTRKQWGLDPSELDASVTARVPVRTNRDDRYFTDTYQSMPLHGYTRMFERMLEHPNIHILLNSDYRDIKSLVPHRQLIYTGPVDEYFDYCFGKLPYRSLRFRLGDARTCRRRSPRRSSIIPTITSTRGSRNSSTCPDRSTRRRRWSTNTRPTTAIRITRCHGRQRGAVCEISSAGRCDAGGAVPRPAGNLQVLQHGPGGGAGAGALREDGRRAAPGDCGVSGLGLQCIEVDLRG